MGFYRKGKSMLSLKQSAKPVSGRGAEWEQARLFFSVRRGNRLDQKNKKEEGFL